MKKEKSCKEKLYDIYTLIVPAGLKITNLASVYASDKYAYIITSHKTNKEIQLSLQGKGLCIK